MVENNITEEVALIEKKDVSPNNEVNLKQCPHQSPCVEIKLFVGRIPVEYDEVLVKDLFSKHSTVTDCIIIRDKITGKHKNSAFVKIASIWEADLCIRSLSGICILDKPLGPLIIRYATGECERLGLPSTASDGGFDQCKLFVGSIPRDAQESQLCEIFTPYGDIDELFILRENTNPPVPAGKATKTSNLNRGCCFVKFRYKEQGLHCIEMLNGKNIFPKIARPIEVKFAESKANLRKLPPYKLSNNEPLLLNRYGAAYHRAACPDYPLYMRNNHLGDLNCQSDHIHYPMHPSMMPNAGGAMPMLYNHLPYYNRDHHFYSQGPLLTNENANMSSGIQSANMYTPSNANAMNRMSATASDMQAGYTMMPNANTTSIQLSNINPKQRGPWKEFFTSDGCPYYHNEYTGITTWDIPMEFKTAILSPSWIPNGMVYKAVSDNYHYDNMIKDVHTMHGNNMMEENPMPFLGPPGANIFIMHIPVHWNKQDLYHHFKSFGNIISCSVSMDRFSRENRGFGFVSFDTIQSAADAVNTMHGVCTPDSNKPLSVSIKRGQEQYTAHLLKKIYLEKASNTVEYNNEEYNNETHNNYNSDNDKYYDDSNVDYNNNEYYYNDTYHNNDSNNNNNTTDLQYNNTDHDNKGSWVDKSNFTSS